MPKRSPATARPSASASTEPGGHAHEGRRHPLADHVPHDVLRPRARAPFERRSPACAGPPTRPRRPRCRARQKEGEAGEAGDEHAPEARARRAHRPRSRPGWRPRSRPCPCPPHAPRGGWPRPAIRDRSSSGRPGTGRGRATARSACRGRGARRSARGSARPPTTPTTVDHCQRPSLSLGVPRVAIRLPTPLSPGHIFRARLSPTIVTLEPPPRRARRSPARLAIGMPMALK